MTEEQFAQLLNRIDRLAQAIEDTLPEFITSDNGDRRRRKPLSVDGTFRTTNILATAPVQDAFSGFIYQSSDEAGENKVSVDPGVRICLVEI